MPKKDKEQTTTKNKKKEGATKIPEKFKPIVQTIEKLTALELSELVKILEEKFGVSAQASMMTMGAVPAMTGEADGAVAEEKSSFNLELTAVGDSKIAVIKIVNEITQKGLKESKDLVDKAPVLVKENMPKEEAETLKKKFEEVGATITLK